MTEALFESSLESGYESDGTISCIAMDVCPTPAPCMLLLQRLENILLVDVELHDIPQYSSQYAMRNNAVRFCVDMHERLHLHDITSMLSYIVPSETLKCTWLQRATRAHKLQEDAICNHIRTFLAKCMMPMPGCSALQTRRHHRAKQTSTLLRQRNRRLSIAPNTFANQASQQMRSKAHGHPTDIALCTRTTSAHKSNPPPWDGHTTSL